MWTVIHIQVRNDGSPPHRKCDSSVFKSRVDAVAHAVKLCEESDPLVAAHLENGGAYWEWEWRRKGNGDYFQVVENFSVQDALNLELTQARDLEELHKAKSNPSEFNMK